MADVSRRSPPDAARMSWRSIRMPSAIPGYTKNSTAGVTSNRGWRKVPRVGALMFGIDQRCFSGKAPWTCATRPIT